MTKYYAIMERFEGKDYFILDFDTKNDAEKKMAEYKESYAKNNEQVPDFHIVEDSPVRISRYHRTYALFGHIHRG